MQEMKPIKEGKVREIYDNGDSLIMVATDRISCFDVILNNVVTRKGTVLTQMSKFWFNMTKDILPNHMISTDVKDMPEFFQQEKFDGNSMMCRKLKMLPLECIVRGYITGSGWASYKENGTVCGIRLPEGLKESDKLPEPIYTPSTKAEIGDHDENISYEQSIDHLEKYYPGKGKEYAEKLKDYMQQARRRTLLAALACIAALISIVLAGRALLSAPAVPASAAISYTVQSENDRLVIRQSDGSVLRTGIDTRTLPSAEQQALADGITLDNAEELARLLENYSS